MIFNVIFSRVKLILILLVIACFVFTLSKKAKVKYGPSGMSSKDSINCSQFSKFARFNPFSVLREKWFVFYYWAPLKLFKTFVFTFPSANHTKHLKRLLNGNVVLPVMWSARQILMENQDNAISLLVERGDRGEYWSYPVAKVKGTYKITPRDIRLKQTGDNRLLGYMDCTDETLLVMARLNDVPRKDKLYQEASRLGYRGRNGRSYLYQGHEWGPIPEADEAHFWDYDKKGKEVSKDTSTEDKSAEGSSEEVESQPTNEPEHSKENKRKDKKTKVVSPVADLDKEMCVKVEPELWNDPKPNSNQDSSLITIEELNNFDDNILETNNTLTIEATDGSASKKQENKLDKESENMQEHDKLDYHKDVQVHEIEMPLNELEKLKLHMESTEPEEENCVVCYKSQVSYISTSEPYVPESTRSSIKKNNEEVPRPKLPRSEVPQDEMPLVEVPRPEIPRGEVPRPDKPQAEVPRPEIPQAEISRAKVPAEPPAPQQDLTNSSEFIILSPKTIDDLKS